VTNGRKERTKTQIKIDHLRTTETAEHPPTDLWPETSTTTSRRTDYPSALQRKRDNFTTLEISQAVANSQQLTGEECPQCHHPQLMFRELQLRSADEGTTVFYTCPECGHRFNTNN
jgi:DNA-directed RNA polymerase I subunit RPA12